LTLSRGMLTNEQRMKALGPVRGLPDAFAISIDR
jgi:hypothetical protein